MSTLPPVLLLDDNLFSSAPITAQLQRMGRSFQTARRVSEMAEAPDLILINLGSRSLNGLQLIEPCRAQFPQARLFGFCGHLEIEIRREAKALGVDKLLTNEMVMSDLERVLSAS